MKILVVDDDPKILMLLNRILTSRGYDVVTANNAAEGFELACQTQPEILITDFDMPDENGLGLIMKLQPTNQETSKIHCILMSGCNKTYIKQICQVTKPDLLTHLLFKPFSLNEILDSVTKAQLALAT